MEKKTSFIFKAMWGVIFVLGIYIIFCGAKDFAKDSINSCENKFAKPIYNACGSYGNEVLYPTSAHLAGLEKDKKEIISSFAQMYGLLNPFSYHAKNDETTVPAMNSQIIASADAELENAKKVVAGSVEALADTKKETQTNADENMQNKDSVVLEEEILEGEENENIDVAATEFDIKGVEYDVNSLTYDFLINNFYTVDSTTGISKERLNAQKLLAMDMTMKNGADKPQILIYHTHSQEGFVDSKMSDKSTTIVGVGEYLTSLLRDNYGFNVIHDTTSYDVIDGKIDRNKAYSLASANVSKILKENPSIEVVIDLHRDGIEGSKAVTEINGKPTAKIMFFNGLSYTNKNGDISYLSNPYIEDNLSFSLKLQIEAAKLYPGFTRKIYLKGYRYNLHLRPKALLIEAGAQNNTFEEELNAMEPLAEVLSRVLKGSN